MIETILEEHEHVTELLIPTCQEEAIEKGYDCAKLEEQIDISTKLIKEITEIDFSSRSKLEWSLNKTNQHELAERLFRLVLKVVSKSYEYEGHDPGYYLEQSNRVLKILPKDSLMNFSEAYSRIITLDTKEFQDNSAPKFWPELCKGFDIILIEYDSELSKFKESVKDKLKDERRDLINEKLGLMSEKYEGIIRDYLSWLEPEFKQYNTSYGYMDLSGGNLEELANGSKQKVEILLGKNQEPEEKNETKTYFNGNPINLASELKGKKIWLMLL